MNNPTMKSLFHSNSSEYSEEQRFHFQTVHQTCGQSGRLAKHDQKTGKHGDGPGTLPQLRADGAD